ALAPHADSFSDHGLYATFRQDVAQGLQELDRYFVGRMEGRIAMWSREEATALGRALLPLRGAIGLCSTAVFDPGDRYLPVSYESVALDEVLLYAVGTYLVTADAVGDAPVDEQALDKASDMILAALAGIDRPLVAYQADALRGKTADEIGKIV